MPQLFIAMYLLLTYLLSDTCCLHLQRLLWIQCHNLSPSIGAELDCWTDHV